MKNFLINKHNYYFYMSNEVADMLQEDSLEGCRLFDNFSQFYEAVNEIFPSIDDKNVLEGSYIELWYDDEHDLIIGDHSVIDLVEFNADNFAQEISDFE